jgi:hypothetical protein
VPFFYITSLIYFTISLNKGVNFYVNLKKIFSRIFLPFLVWNCIYYGLLAFKDMLTGSERAFNLWRVFFYGESAEHLYYLPELIIMQVIIMGVLLLITSKMKNEGLCALLLVICYLACGYWYKCYGVNSSASIILYVISAFYIAPMVLNGQNSYWYLIVGLIMIFLSVSAEYIAYFPIISNYVIPLPIAGVGLLLIVLNISKMVAPNWVLSLSSATYGIYLSHIVFLEAIDFLIEKINYSIYYSVAAKVAVAFVVFLMSLIFTLLVKKIPVLRMLLLGEKK